MDNKIIITSRTSMFFSKIITFFKKILKSNKNNILFDEDFIEIEPLDDQDKNFIESIKVENTNINELISFRKLLEKIEDNYEELVSLPIDTLISLKKYYDRIFEENEKIIKNLKK